MLFLNLSPNWGKECVVCFRSRLLKLCLAPHFLFLFFLCTCFIIFSLRVDPSSSERVFLRMYGALYEPSSPRIGGWAGPSATTHVASSRMPYPPSPLTPNKPVTTVNSVSMSVASREREFSSGGLPSATSRSLQNNNASVVRWEPMHKRALYYADERLRRAGSRRILPPIGKWILPPFGKGCFWERSDHR